MIQNAITVVGFEVTESRRVQISCIDYIILINYMVMILIVMLDTSSGSTISILGGNCVGVILLSIIVVVCDFFLGGEGGKKYLNISFE